MGKIETEKKEETFSLKSHEGVESFEEFLDEYETAKAMVPLKHISLTTLYDYLPNDQDGGRIFAAILDIRISFLLLNLDLHAARATWNEYFSKGKLEYGSVLDSPEKFFGKMDIHRCYTAFVFRYRALFDKLMGLIVLICVPWVYDKQFAGKDSKKKAFSSIVEKYKLADGKSIFAFIEMLTEFDKKFRTAEAHGTGVLRKYTFLMELTEIDTELSKFWNKINGVMSELGKWLLVVLKSQS